MYDTLYGQFNKLKQYLHLEDVKIDNLVFRMHYIARQDPFYSFNVSYFYLIIVVL